MTLDYIFEALRERDAVLVVRDGALRYIGPAPLAADDPLRAGVAAHRDQLIVMFAPARELCVFQDALLAPGDRIFCTYHRAEADAIPMPWDRPAPVPTIEPTGARRGAATYPEERPI